MSGIIGVPCNDIARYSMFSASLTGLHHPPNTEVVWRLGSDRIRGRNRIVETAQDRGAEWVLFLDDDHSFGPGLLLQLLAHRVDLAASLYLGRTQPFFPVAYTDRLADGTYRPLRLADYPLDTGLVEVRAAGTGGMLIRMEVFRDLVDQGICDQGVWFKDGAASEDLNFCERCRDAGYTIHVDLATRLGHCTSSVVWPEQADGQWTVGAQIGTDFLAHFPMMAGEQDLALSGDGDRNGKAAG